MKKSATKLSRGRKRQAGGAKEARGSIAPPMVRAGKRPKLSETDPERVWEKVNPLMYRVHHGQPSLEEIVSCLAEYDDKSRPLRDFGRSSGLAVLSSSSVATFAGSHAHA